MIAFLVHQNCSLDFKGFDDEICICNELGPDLGPFGLVEDVSVVCVAAVL